MGRRERNIGMMFIILFCLIVIFTAFIYLNPFNKKELTSSDFKIKSIEWYGDGYLNVNWSKTCREAEKGETKVNFYSFTTKQNYFLYCKLFINGEETSYHYGSSPFDNFDRDNGEIHQALVRDSINPLINNTLKICCIPSVSEENIQGEVCDSIVIASRC
jgi:hypothetical protein